jgi:hypothetical protein
MSRKIERGEKERSGEGEIMREKCIDQQKKEE